MSMEWSLTEIYPSIDSGEFKNDWEKLTASLVSYKAWAKNLQNVKNITKAIEEYINFRNELELCAGRLGSFLQLTLSVEATNADAMRKLDRLFVLIAQVAEPEASFILWLKNVDGIKEMAKESEIIKEHLFSINELKLASKYTLSEAEEAVISNFKNTGSTAWSNLHDMVTSTLMVDISLNGEEKKLPLPAVRNMAYEADAELRKSAYEAELKSYEKIKEPSAAALNGIKGQVIAECEMRGYKSPLEMTLIRSRLDENTLNAMFTAVKESLPSFVKYFKAKAKLLGYEGGLHFYDLFAPVGNVSMTFTYEEAMKYVIDNLTKFSKNLGDFAQKAFDNNWIDVLPKEGKRGGAFCAGIGAIKESRILTNFTGSFSDMLTLAHELGHGYHNECAKDETPLNENTPMQLAETASTFAEILVTKAALKTASKEEALVILENYISGSAQVVVDILSRYIFETNVFQKRQEGYISTDELKEMMLEAQKEAYGEGLNHEVLHPYMWACKTHYYSAEYNFYNFPYAFGQLFATGLYTKYLEEGESFTGKYMSLLASTGRMDSVSVAKLADVDITSVDFWRSSLEFIKEDIEQFIALSESN